MTGLVGSSGQRAKPTPVSNIEMKKMKERVVKITSDFEAGKIAPMFNEGQIVEVIDGASKGLYGPVLEINQDRQVAVLELILFERKTPVEVAFKNLKVKE